MTISLRKLVTTGFLHKLRGMSINQKQWKNKKYLYYFDVTNQINHLPQIYVLS